MGRSTRSNIFPDYIPEQLQERNIFLLEGHKVYNQHGQAKSMADSQDIVSHLFSQNGLYFVQSLVSPQVFPYLDEMLHLRMDNILSTKKGIPLAVRLHRKEGTRWIIQLDAWDRNNESVFSPQDTFTHITFGTRPTPGSLGSWSQRIKWGQYGLSYHTEACKLAREFLYTHHIGGRCDTPGVGSYHEIAIELDMASAYLAHCLLLPTGTAMRYHSVDRYLFATYFTECQVTIHAPLALGPFPIRVPGRGRCVSYPTEPGTYHAFLWKEEIEDCIRAGCTVREGRGWGWSKMTDDMENWARWIYYKKMTAPNDAVEDDIKKLIVATFGRFGSRGLYYTLVGEEEALGLHDKGEPCTIGEDGPYGYFVRERKDLYSPRMIHWYSYIIMQCRRTLYSLALPYALDGRLIATNYDALYVVEGNEAQRYLRKYTLEAKMASMGDLRWTRLHQFYVKASRSYDAWAEMPDGRLIHRKVTPGVKHE